MWYVTGEVVYDEEEMNRKNLLWKNCENPCDEDPCWWKTGFRVKKKEK